MTTKNISSFELRVGFSIDVPVILIVGFMQRDQFNQQHQNNDTFYRPSVVQDQIFIGSEKYQDAGISCNNAMDKFFQAFEEIATCFRHLAKDDILHPCFTQIGFIVSNEYENDNPGYNLHVFELHTLEILVLLDQ